jgi:hypothetical protein
MCASSWSLAKVILRCTVGGGGGTVCKCICVHIPTCSMPQSPNLNHKVITAGKDYFN